MNGNIVSRIGGALALGAATTAAVLWLMQTLIESDSRAVDDALLSPPIVYLPLIEETPPERANRKPDEPPPPTVPPVTPPITPFPSDGPVIGTAIEPPTVDGPTRPIGSGLVEGDALPVVKVRPVYPDNAARRGIEGHVLVQFTIDELGRVSNVEVLEAEPSGVFDRAAVRAVERFRYKPRVVNGAAIPVSGVQHLLTFQLDS